MQRKFTDLIVRSLSMPPVRHAAIMPRQVIAVVIIYLTASSLSSQWLKEVTDFSDLIPRPNGKRMRASISVLLPKPGDGADRNFAGKSLHHL